MKLSWFDSRDFKISISDAGREFADDVMTGSSKKSYLQTDIRATHSGHLITGRCYTGWGMQRGVGSWFDMKNGGGSAFDKPIIVNHDMHSEPLGRVTRAEFTQLKTGSEWIDDWKDPDFGPGKLGSGYSMLSCNIFDMDAIAKILDGRYKTVSTRQMAHDAWCSIDGIRFAEGCDHEIGQYYEIADGSEAECFAVTGLLEGVECSMVNGPRQENAMVMNFQMMGDALRDSDENGVVLVGETWNDDAAEVSAWLRAKDSEVIVNLSDTDLPSVGVLTGKKQVSMAKITGAHESVQLDGLEAAQQKTLEDNSEINSDESDSVEEIKEAKDEVKDFAFANLARHWADDLDLETEFKDSHYINGITDKSAGHAHTFDAFIDENRVMTGSTWSTGQGKTKHSHGHSIWAPEMDLNVDSFKGDTRGASAGEEHTHSFTTNMSDSESVCVTLVACVDDIKAAAKLLDERVNTDTLQSDQSEALLDNKDTSITWDDDYRRAAMRLLGRLPASKRRQIIDEMNVDSNQEEVLDMDAVATALLADLLADKAKLTAQVAELTQLNDSKESERQTLLDENVKLKANVFELKASLVVKAQDSLSEEKLDEEALAAKIEEFAAKDEVELDALLDTEVLGQLRKEVVVEDADDQSETEDVKDEEDPTAGAPIDAVKDTVMNKKDSALERAGPKSLLSLDNRVSTQRRNR